MNSSLTVKIAHETLLHRTEQTAEVSKCANVVLPHIQFRPLQRQLWHPQPHPMIQQGPVLDLQTLSV
jgi:hypothetical protein